jgi:hypothetical protein
VLKATADQRFVTISTDKTTETGRRKFNIYNISLLTLNQPLYYNKMRTQMQG